MHMHTCHNYSAIQACSASQIASICFQVLLVHLMEVTGCYNISSSQKGQSPWAWMRVIVSQGAFQSPFRAHIRATGVLFIQLGFSNTWRLPDDDGGKASAWSLVKSVLQLIQGLARKSLDRIKSQSLLCRESVRFPPAAPAAPVG